MATQPFHEARDSPSLLAAAAPSQVVTTGLSTRTAPKVPMFGFRFLAGDAVAAVLTYSSSSSTALLSYQPGAKVPARGKVRRGLTRSPATLAFDSWMCIIGPYGRHETCRKACGRRLPAEALKTRRWHIEGWRTSAGGVLPPPRRRALFVQWSYVCMYGIGLAYAANDVLQCARCRHARLHAR